MNDKTTYVAPRARRKKAAESGAADRRFAELAGRHAAALRALEASTEQQAATADILRALSRSAGDSQAVIEYEGETFVVHPGSKVPDDIAARFEVKNVTDACVEVFDRVSQRLVSRCLP